MDEVLSATTTDPLLLERKQNYQQMPCIQNASYSGKPARNG
jgi:hypothetical protein